MARSDILHSIDRVLPQAPSIFNDLQNFLSDQGFPQVFSTLTPPSSAVRVHADRMPKPEPWPHRPPSRRSRSSGTACNNVQEGSGFVVGKGLVVTNAHVVAGEGSGDTHGAGRRDRLQRDRRAVRPEFDLAVLRTDAPLGPRSGHQSQPGDPGHARRRCSGYPENGSLTIGPAGVTEEVTAIGKDIYNKGSVTRGVYALDATVEPGNSGGPLVGPGGQVIGVVFSRSTVYPDVGYALTSPGVLARVAQASAAPRGRGHGSVHLGLTQPGRQE